MQIDTNLDNNDFDLDISLVNSPNNCVDSDNDEKDDVWLSEQSIQVQFEDELLKQQEKRHIERTSIYAEYVNLEKSYYMSDHIPIYILSSYNFRTASVLYFEVSSYNYSIKTIYWRIKPSILGTDFKYIERIEKRSKHRGFFIVFIDSWELHIILKNTSDEREFIEMLKYQIESQRRDRALVDKEVEVKPLALNSPKRHSTLKFSSQMISTFMHLFLC